MRCVPSRHAFLAGSIVISFTRDDLENFPVLHASIARQQAKCCRCDAADRSCIVNAERLWDEHKSSQSLGISDIFLDASPNDTLGA